MASPDLFTLSGRKAIVTGGSRGLGLQIARALGRQGAELVIGSRKADELSATAEALRSEGIVVHAIAVDLADAEKVAAFADAAIEALGHVDILVNNAGAAWAAPAEDHPFDAWQKLVNVNLTGVFVLSQRIGKLSMIPRKYGRILNVASIAGLAGNPPGTNKTLAYNTTKGGVVNFTRALAGEWGEHGITVNAIAPGFFPSRMTQASLGEFEAKLIDQTPLRRIGDDEDLMGAALLFCSDAGKHITGQILAVDGGVSAV